MASLKPLGRSAFWYKEEIIGSRRQCVVLKCVLLTSFACTDSEDVMMVIRQGAWLHEVPEQQLWTWST